MLIKKLNIFGNREILIKVFILDFLKIVFLICFMLKKLHVL